MQHIYRGAVPQLHILEQFCEALGGEAWWICGLGLESIAEVRNVSVAVFQVEHGEVERGADHNLPLVPIVLARGNYFAVTGHQPHASNEDTMPKPHGTFLERIMMYIHNASEKIRVVVTQGHKRFQAFVFEISCGPSHAAISPALSAAGHREAQLTVSWILSRRLISFSIVSRWKRTLKCWKSGASFFYASERTNGASHSSLNFSELNNLQRFRWLQKVQKINNEKQGSRGLDLDSEKLKI